MKSFFLCVGVLVLTSCASTTHFVDRSALVETPFVIGQGSTQQEALRSALASVPVGYEVETNGTKVSGCADVAKTPFWSTQSQEYVCLGSPFQSLIAVLPSNAVERDQILVARAAAQEKSKLSIGGNKYRKPSKSLIENNREATASVIEPTATKTISVE